MPENVAIRCSLLLPSAKLLRLMKSRVIPNMTRAIFISVKVIRDRLFWEEPRKRSNMPYGKMEWNIPTTGNSGKTEECFLSLLPNPEFIPLSDIWEPASRKC